MITTSSSKTTPSLVEKAGYHLKKTGINTFFSCFTNDRAIIKFVQCVVMKDKPLASALLNHYLHENGKDWRFDIKMLLSYDTGLRTRLYSDIGRNRCQNILSGVSVISQCVYQNNDLLYALGRVKLHWKIESEYLNVRFRKRYCWHPHQPRITQRIHKAADRLKVLGAQEFDIVAINGKLDLPRTFPPSGGKDCNETTMNLL